MSHPVSLISAIVALATASLLAATPSRAFASAAHTVVTLSTLSPTAGTTIACDGDDDSSDDSGSNTSGSAGGGAET